MTEQQIWFLLIFSVPFIPAIIVFKLIKPKSGDAKIGGRIPIVKDLQIELGGAIATYVVIVLIALLAFSKIVEDKRLTVKIQPQNSEGQYVGLSDVNLEKLMSSSFDLVVRSDSGDRFLLSDDDFEFDEKNFHFLANPEIYVRSVNRQGKLYFEPGGSRFVSSPDSNAALATTKNGEYSLRLQVEADLLADWIARVDLFWITVRETTVDTVQVTVLQDNSRDGISRIRFGASNVSGLAVIEANAWDGSNEIVERYLANVTKVSKTTEWDTSTKLFELSSELIEAHNGRGIDRGVWTSDNPKGLVKNTGPDDPSVYFVHAPSKRIDLPSAMGGRFVIISEKTSAKFSIDPAEYSPGVVYAHATNVAAIFIEIDANITSEFRNAPRIRSSGRNEGTVSEENIFRDTNRLAIVETELPKETSVTVKF